MPPAHLILEEPGEEQALCAGHFHHLRVAAQRAVGDEVVEDRAQIFGGRPIGRGPRRDLGVVREDAGVVQQLLPIDGRVGDIPKTHEKKLEDVPLIGREQFPQRTHDAS